MPPAVSLRRRLAAARRAREAVRDAPVRVTTPPRRPGVSRAVEALRQTRGRTVS